MASPTAAITQSPQSAPRPSDVILERLGRLHPKVIDLSLGRMERLLYRLGNPERDLPPVVHVAGTNGKGSVIAYLAAMLRSAGRRAHLYTSPHLVRFHERIALDGRPIDEPALLALLEECEVANGPSPITFFEITTAAAFLAFARHPADILLLETGLGGRLDATNVIDDPLLTVITPVSIDHVDFLGGTLAEIAGEKAGILKPGVPAVIGRQPAEALAVIERRAAALGVPLSRAGREWDSGHAGGGLSFTGRGGAQRYPAPGLPGAHQVENAALAVATAEQLEGFGLGSQARAEGLRTARWPARLQRLTRGPLPELLPAGWELWLDGGHNAAAGQALAETLGAWNDKPLHLLFAMMNSKSVADFIGPLGARAASLQTVAIPGEVNSLSAEAAAAAAREAGLPASPADGLAAALAALATEAGAPSRVLICGSLYLAGTVLRENG